MSGSGELASRYSLFPQSDQELGGFSIICAHPPVEEEEYDQ